MQCNLPNEHQSFHGLIKKAMLYPVTDDEEAQAKTIALLSRVRGKTTKYKKTKTGTTSIEQAPKYFQGSANSA
jgi:hypothetical protein